MFGEFPKGNIEGDKKFRKEWVKNTNNEYLTKEDLYSSLEHKGIGNVELVKGDITQTLHEYIKEHPEMRISMLHIDTDIYEPAKIGLELLYDRVVRGGVIILDDYGTVEGETVAVDEFFKDKKCIIKKFPFSHKKPSYIIKP